MQLRKFITSKYFYIFNLVFALCCQTSVSAEPQNGFGAYGGFIGASENSINSKGLSVGADAQFVIDENWSLNPYLMASLEHSSASTTVSDELVGMQIRHWFGDWFIGGQVFAHDRLIIGNGSTQSSAYGVAPGVLAGVEYASGWGAIMQADTFENSNIPGATRNAVRLHLTYRWH